ncbi:uncharacterized protein LOC125178715 [Hyalella azteca]|uniref:Uncharacterized protein LOC125178715 n=1 Tax=Hyalella azteca TaxID=294128 RepID=A0A979FSJ6_HYAAZ|nr:uncharacterized protein LOC125178715 [Hyalella azteca]
MFVPLTATLASAGTAMGCYGFGVGAYVVLLPTLLAKTLGVKRLPVAYGFTRLTMGFMSLVAPQVNGALVDGTGSYAPTYYLMGSCTAVAAILFLFIPPPVTEEPDTAK